MKNLYILIFALLAFSCQTHVQEVVLAPSQTTKELSQNWSFEEVDGDLKGKATVPGTIHTDLLAEGKIKNPFYRTNEKDLQWIDKKDWVYHTIFEINEAELANTHIELDFKGLDTYADVYLNDELLFEADNMFREWRVDVKNVLKKGENQLKIYFHSPITKGLSALENSPYGYPAGNDQSENGGVGDKKVSVFTRKAGYHYGWDWGPRFVTSGIWRPVSLKMWSEVKINDVFIAQPEVTAQRAKLSAELSINADDKTKGQVQLINEATGEVFVSEQIELNKGSNEISLPFSIAKPKLWWSHGLGEAYLYDFKVVFQSENGASDLYTIKTGLRKIELVREKDEDGESFLFKLNGVPVFMKGANYIPNDNFLPRVDKQEYDQVIADAVNANMNMLRIWGGGIYEDDYFYDLCDKNGILIWQDFMFACSMYPSDSAFIDNIRAEAKDNVERLRNHPSIALWCGNNEINTAWHYGSEGGWGWKERYTSEQQEELQKGYLKIFHEVLPQVVKQYTDGDDYWPSSPQAGHDWQKHASYDNTSGDMHYWGVWHGLHPFADFEKYKARFMSEYGFQSFPDLEIVETYAVEEDYDIESEVMAAHQRSGIGNLRIKEYMSWEYDVPSDFDDFLYMSQVLQAKGTKMAIEAHRRAMPYCMGTLFWQINDCWPVASWSSTDYTHKWKAMHYTVKKLYQPVMLSLKAGKDQQLDIYGVSDYLNDTTGILKMSLMTFSGDTISYKEEKLKMKANTSEIIKTLSIAEMMTDQDTTSTFLAVDFSVSDNVLADNIYYFATPKNQHLSHADIKITSTKSAEGVILQVNSPELAREVYLNYPGLEDVFSDNYFDIIPNKVYSVELQGVKDFDVDRLTVKQLSDVQNNL